MTVNQTATQCVHHQSSSISFLLSDFFPLIWPTCCGSACSVLNGSGNQESSMTGPQGLMVLTLDHCSIYLTSPENLFLFVKMQTRKKGLFTALTSGPHETRSSSKATNWHQSDLDHMRRLWRPGLESDVNVRVDKHVWDISHNFLTLFKWIVFITNTF